MRSYLNIGKGYILYGNMILLYEETDEVVSCHECIMCGYNTPCIMTIAAGVKVSVCNSSLNETDKNVRITRITTPSPYLSLLIIHKLQPPKKP